VTSFSLGAARPPNKELKLTKLGRLRSFAADMERPVSSPRDQVVDVVPPWGSETTVKAGRFDDESL
jgi:hypothetical protein